MASRPFSCCCPFEETKKKTLADDWNFISIATDEFRIKVGIKWFWTPVETNRAVQYNWMFLSSLSSIFLFYIHTLISFSLFLFFFCHLVVSARFVRPINLPFNLAITWRVEGMRHLRRWSYRIWAATNRKTFLFGQHFKFSSFLFFFYSFILFFFLVFIYAIFPPSSIPWNEDIRLSSSSSLSALSLSAVI